MRGILDMMMIGILLVISVEDAREKKISNGYVGGLLILGIIHMVVVFPKVWDPLGGFWGFGGLLLLLYFLSGGRIIGAGDIKLLAVCGLRLGFDRIARAFLLGASLGMIVQIIRRKFFRGEAHFPMGPWLSFGIIWMLFQ